MGTYTGTGNQDNITPTEVTAGVIRDPLGSFPSDAIDRIYGLGGNDILDSGAGPDSVSGGDGNDSIRFHGAGSTVHGDAGDDLLIYEARDDAVFGAAYGDDGNDHIALVSWQEEGSATGTVLFHGGDGNDFIEVDGTDMADFSGLSVYERGGAGNDRLEATSLLTFSMLYPFEGGNNDDYMFGGPGDDSYYVLEQKDIVIENADEGYDTVEVYWTDYALPANIEKLVANNVAADDLPLRYDGNDLDNVILGANGSETIFGAAGNDTIRGGSWNDIIDGGPGADRLYGDEDNDKLFGNDGDDRMYGGDGNDEMGGQSGNDLMYGGAGIDQLGGGRGNDALWRGRRRSARGPRGPRPAQRRRRQ